MHSLNPVAQGREGYKKIGENTRVMGVTSLREHMQNLSQTGVKMSSEKSNSSR